MSSSQIAVQSPLTIQQQEKIPLAYNDFPYFTEHVFSHSYAVLKNGEWIGGPYIEDITRWMQENRKTMRVSARDHFKSMGLYSHFEWQLFQSFDRDLEAHYFSFSKRMAEYHVAKIKKAIKSNPFFATLVDNNPLAKSIIDFSWPLSEEEVAAGKIPPRITLEPHGLFDFKRGIHSGLIYIDDPFQDPKNKMIITAILAVNEVVKKEIIAGMVQDQLHIVGTAQTNEDFFFDVDLQETIAFRKLPAIQDEKNKVVLWPEWMDWNALMAKKKQVGEKAFNQEYLVIPARAEDAFLDREDLYRCMNNSLPNLDHRVDQPTDNDRILGWDLGKRRHPAHVSVFELDGRNLRQVHVKYFDKKDYNDQLRYVKQLIENLHIDFGYYDASRGELDALVEQGEVPPELEGVAFTHKRKNSMANMLSILITRALSEEKTDEDSDLDVVSIEFINDKRSLDQMLMVDNDLNAVETPEGHGDSFWSTCLALYHFSEASSNVIVV